MDKCEKCNPIMQVRGQMGDGDYFDVVANDQAARDRSLYPLPDDYHLNVELDDSNKTDVRMICRKCHRSTGWIKADAPGMPGVGIDFAKRQFAKG